MTLYNPLSQYSHGFNALDTIKIFPEYHIKILSSINPFSAYTQMILICIMFNNIAEVLNTAYASSYNLNFKLDDKFMNDQQNLIKKIQELDEIYLLHEKDITNYI
jgi:hypothetical protein